MRECGGGGVCGWVWVVVWVVVWVCGCGCGCVCGWVWWCERGRVVGGGGVGGGGVGGGVTTFCRLRFLAFSFGYLLTRS